MVKLKSLEEAAPRLEEAARVSEEEEENKSFICKLLIPSIDVRNIRFEYNRRLDLSPKTKDYYFENCLQVPKYLIFFKIFTSFYIHQVFKMLLVVIYS